MKKSILFLIITLWGNFSIFAQTLKDEWVVCNSDGCKILDTYYSDGVTMEWHGKCVNGKADGHGTLIKYKNGEYESTFEGECKNGIREGQGKFTHKDGSVKEGEFVNAQLTGKGIGYYPEGHKYIGEFINYRKHGNGIFEYPNGAKFEGFFVADQPYTGKFTDYDGTVTYIQEYYPVSKIYEKKSYYKPEIGTRVTEYFDDNWNRCQQRHAKYYRLITYEAPNKPQGIIKDYYISGELQSEFYAVYIDYDDEGKNFHEGEAIWYYKNGKIEQKRYYYNNKINGKNTFYYENGQLAQEIHYDHGDLNGSYKQWYQTGKIRLSAFYENGTLQNDKYIEYDENGLGALVYHENFLKNRSNWESESKENISTILSDNQVLLKVLKDSPTARAGYVTLEQNSDYSIESIVRKVNGADNNGYGIIFGFKDWNNYYHFLISGNGSYMISETFEGVSLNIAEWTFSKHINKGNGRNMLKVFKLNDTFVFSINGHVVEQKEAGSLRGNHYGILAGGKGEYILENILIKEFVSSETLAEKSRSQEESALQNVEWKGNGTGFFIDRRGYIATNYHVVEDAKEIEIEFLRNGERLQYKMQVVQSDKQNDLAILKITDPDFVPFQNLNYNFQTSTKEAGTPVFALGYPLANVMGSEIKFTDGKLSSKTGVQGNISMYQISVPIQPGNSGGPLFDYDGNLIGITSFGLNREYFNAENVNYAIKSSYLNNLVEVLSTSLELPKDQSIHHKTLTEKIKILSHYVVLIKVR